MNNLFYGLGLAGLAALGERKKPMTWIRKRRRQKWRNFQKIASQSPPIVVDWDKYNTLKRGNKAFERMIEATMDKYGTSREKAVTQMVPYLGVMDEKEIERTLRRARGSMQAIKDFVIKSGREWYG